MLPREVTEIPHYHLRRLVQKWHNPQKCQAEKIMHIKCLNVVTGQIKVATKKKWKSQTAVS